MMRVARDGTADRQQAVVRRMATFALREPAEVAL
jgi:hypothetical protein